MADCLIVEEQPELLAPYIIVGLSGWLDAGEVSTGSVDYLRRKLDAHKFAYIEPRGFYIYQVPGYGPEQILRPHARIEEGLVKRVEGPRNEFFFWKSGADHDLILLSGVEPNLAWPEFAQAVLNVAQQFRAARIYALGGVFDQVPHTRETRLYAVISHPQLKNEIKKFAPFLTYEGPSSFTTTLLSLAGQQGIEAAGITARVPPYIQNYNSKASYDLLKRIIALTGIEIDINDLKKAGELLAEMINRAFIQNQTAMEQLKKMEEIFDAANLDMPNQVPGENYDKLLEEMIKMKRDGRKPH